MILFARSVTNNVKSHTPQLKALHSKSTPQLTAAGIRSVTRNKREGEIENKPAYYLAKACLRSKINSRERTRERETP